jgi:murein DD-endopeptidase MepM/ murein hydrolase activator NlpD
LIFNIFKSFINFKVDLRNFSQKNLTIDFKIINIYYLQRNRLLPLKTHRGKISILIVPEEDGEPRSFRLSWRLLKAIIWALGALLLVFVAGIVASSLVLNKAINYSKLAQDNQKLMEDNRRVVKLSQDLERLEAMNEQIRNALGANIGVDSLPNKIEVDYSAPDFALNGSFFRNANPAFIAPLKGHITRGFSEGLYPRLGHSGVDISTPEGATVFASADGWVAFTGWHQRYGNLLVLQHPGDFLTFYGHNLSFLVNVGDKVSAGRAIALSGNTGQSSAPHLHFEIRKRGCALDPTLFIPDFK